MVRLPLTALLPGSSARDPRPTHAPEPPVDLPPGRTIAVPGRGEFFVRDTGEDDRPAVLLLHGWMFSADLNWFTTYGPLHDAGLRVIALDHRGHGRGLRSPDPFRLTDCADDAAAVLDALGAAPATVVGYSMGGAIGQLLAHRHPDAVRGLVLSATSSEWRDARMRLLWNAMAGLRLLLGLFPDGMWRGAMRTMGAPDSATTTWHAVELARGNAADLAEAGRELGRFDARPWHREIRAPRAVVMTADDTSVPPAKQRELAERLDAPLFSAPGTHGAVTAQPRTYNAALLDALRAVGTLGEREPELAAVS